MQIWDFVNAINFGKQDLFEDPQAEKDYVPFIVNRALSYFPDTVLYANEMNRCSGISKQWQFDFLKNSVSKRKRFSKWAKKDQSPADLAVVQEFYGYSKEKAAEALEMLTQQQIDEIKSSLFRGGR